MGNPSIDFMFAAIATPIEVIPTASSSTSGISAIALTKVATENPYMNGKNIRISRIAACIIAWLAPPMILPNATLERGTGDTSTSLRKPNSLSQSMEIAENTEVNSTVIPRIPGNMNWMYLVFPPPNTLNAACRPVPSRNR